MLFVCIDDGNTNKQTSKPAKQPSKLKMSYSSKPHRNESRKEYTIPDKPYSLDECESPEDEIRRMTNRYAGFASDVKDRLFTRLDHRKHTTSIYGRFNAPLSREMVEKINGSDEYFLKKTMEASDIDLIWYDSEYNKYRFWGPSKFKVVDAMNRIRSRIIKYVVHVQPEQYQAKQYEEKRQENRQENRQEKQYEEKHYQAKQYEEKRQAKQYQPKDYEAKQYQPKHYEAKQNEEGQSSFMDWEEKVDDFDAASYQKQEQFKLQQKAHRIKMELFEMNRDREFKKEQDDGAFLVKKILEFDPEIVSSDKYKKGGVLPMDVLQQFSFNGNFQKLSYAKKIKDLQAEMENEDAENLRQDINHEIEDLIEKKKELDTLLKQTQTHLLLSEREYSVCVDETMNDLMPMMSCMRLN